MPLQDPSAYYPSNSPSRQFSPQPGPIGQTEEQAGGIFSFPYYIDPNQLTPVFHASGNPNVFAGPGTKTFTGGTQFELADFFDQLERTSGNVRDRTLRNILGQMNVPMEQMYAAGLVGQAAGQRTSQLDQLRAAMAKRGMSQSGVMDEGRLGTEFNYLQSVGAAQQQARTQELGRQGQLAQQLLGISANDLEYWKYLNAGRNVLLGQTQPTDIGALSGLTRGVSGLAAGALLGNNQQPTQPLYSNNNNFPVTFGGQPGSQTTYYGPNQTYVPGLSGGGY